MPSIFSKIVSGDIPSHKVAETENYLAFLDISPVVPGHTLVIPKKEVDRLFDLDRETYDGLFRFVRKVSRAIKKSYDCDRVGMTVIGLEVPHAHVHLMPISSMSDMDFRNKSSVSQEELAASAALISSNFKD